METPKRLGFYEDKQKYLNFYKTMQVREEKIDALYMDIIDILGKNYDTDIAKAVNVAEQIAELVNELYEDGE